MPVEPGHCKDGHRLLSRFGDVDKLCLKVQMLFTVKHQGATTRRSWVS